VRARDLEIIVGWVTVAVLGSCATTYSPIKPEVVRSGDTQLELQAIRGRGELVVHVASGSDARVGPFRLMTGQSPPCSGGTELLVFGSGKPVTEVAVRGEQSFVLTSIDGAAPLTGADVVLDFRIAREEEGCLRLPVAGPTDEVRWVARHGWSLVGDISFAPNFTPNRSAWTTSVEPRLWIDRFQFGIHYQLGFLDCSDCGKGVIAGGPLAGARLIRAGRWALDMDAAYEVGGIQAVGFVHGPRLELSILRSARPPMAAFQPEFLFAGYGLILSGGHWFVPGAEVSRVWYGSFGLTVALGI
jgi:hypothetical protein